MDPSRFDFLTRALSATPSRRGIARALAGLTLVGALAPLLGLSDSEAKNKKKKKKTCRNCGPCQTCSKGTCKAKTDGTACVGGRICLGGTCACGPGREEIADRCAAPCGAACTATCNFCVYTFDTRTAFCGREPDGTGCSSALPCANHSGCSTNELCVATVCDAVNGVTNRCVALC